MRTPPIHNSIVQWKKTSPIFLNIFDTPEPHYFFLTQYEDIEKPVPFTAGYGRYMKDVKTDNPVIYIPTTATTPEEALSLYPELFI